MSVPVAVGFIALAGVAAEIGVVMLVYLDHAYDALLAERGLLPENEPRDVDAEAIRSVVEAGAGLRLRPVMMVVPVVYSLWREWQPHP